MCRLKLSMLALSLAALAGCKAINAMDNTETMKNDLAAMKTTTGGMAGTTASMEANTLEMKRKMSVGEGLKNFNAPENNEHYVPPSDGLLAGAKLIAENMTSEELMVFTLARLKVIEKTMPDEMKLNRGLKGMYPADYLESFNRFKHVKLVGLQAIAAAIPQPMIEKIVREQIFGKGERRSQAYALLYLRAHFINEFYLNNTLFSSEEKIDTFGKLQLAYTYAKQLQFLAEQPFADKIYYRTPEGTFLKSLNAPTYFRGEEGCVSDEQMLSNPECNVTVNEPYRFNELNETLDKKIGKFWLKKILQRLEKEMPEEELKAYAREIQEIKEDCQRYVGQN